MYLAEFIQKQILNVFSGNAFIVFHRVTSEYCNTACFFDDLREFPA